MHFRTRRRVIVMVAGALDEGRIGGFEPAARDVLPDLQDTRIWSEG